MPLFATAVVAPTMVTGTVTTSPSGTQNVAITSPATLPVSGTVTATPTGTQVVSGTVSTVPGMLSGVSFYSTALADLPGVVAANNFLSLFNPVGSGKTITLYALNVVPWASALTASAVSMSLFRVSAASVGTLIAAANVNRMDTTSANPVAEVRTGNPTVTTVGTMLSAFPPALSAAKTGANVPTPAIAPNSASFVMAAGQGLVIRTASGDVNQLWNLAIAWSES